MAYLIITDAATSYTWVFPTKTKKSDVQLIIKFLHQNGNKHSNRKELRMDKGEYATSQDFRDALFHATGYLLEPTAPDTPSQNGKVERQNGSLGTMVRSLLYASGLTPDFWSDSLIYSVYLKNRTWHKRICKTPHEA